ncbi:hypothetical protein BCY76_006975 [Nesterenkonia sp. PF2B19]|nr:hypothetical protein BCY76_006975 [Nesterenkonia sp. PF2B19]
MRTAHAAIVDAVESGRLEADRLAEAAERVVALMLWQQDLAAGDLDAGPGVALPEVLQGLEEEVEQDGGGYADLPSITGEDAGEDAGEDTGDGAAEVAAAVARHAVTLVAGQCEADVLQGPVTVVGGQEQDRARLESALLAAGHQLGAGGTVIGLVAPGRSRRRAPTSWWPWTVRAAAVCTRPRPRWPSMDAGRRASRPWWRSWPAPRRRAPCRRRWGSTRSATRSAEPPEGVGRPKPGEIDS